MLKKFHSRLMQTLKTPGRVESILSHIEGMKGPNQAAFERIMMSQGAILENFNRAKPSKALQDYEYKVFSQWGEDGIIQKLISSIEIKHRTFIEFGVEDFIESNCRYLMMNNKWSGFVIDGSPPNVAKMKRYFFYWKNDLNAMAAFITRENINGLLKESGFDRDVGILSIDIDGVDYWVLEAITAYEPRILITEYNAVFGKERKITVPYSDDFNRTKHHYSNLYFGASLAAMAHIARKKGYTLVGTNSAGVNAFFVRDNLMNGSLRALSAEEGYTASVARESRDRSGELTHISGTARLEAIRGLPVINVETGAQEVL
jgi:hypothetical protein